MATKLLILSNVNLICFPLFCAPPRIYNLIVFRAILMSGVKLVVLVSAAHKRLEPQTLEISATRRSLAASQMALVLRTFNSQVEGSNQMLDSNGLI